MDLEVLLEERSKESQPLDVIHVQVGQQDVDAPRFVVRVANAPNASARVEDDDRAVAAFYLGTCGVAAIVDGLGSGAGDRTKETPALRARVVSGNCWLG